jgi:hypothetical protein
MTKLNSPVEAASESRHVSMDVGSYRGILLSGVQQ